MKVDQKPRTFRAALRDLNSRQASSAFSKRSPAHYRIMPWANGKGNTTELFVFPKGSNIKDGSALWRVSMADVPSDGPFSVLPAYQRIITVVDGVGFHLTGSMGTDLAVVSGVIHQFPGAEEIQGRLLLGSCLDLNVMYRQDEVEASMELLASNAEIRTAADGTIILICLLGRGVAKVFGKLAKPLARHESVILRSRNERDTLNLSCVEPGSLFALARFAKKPSLALR